VSCCRDSPLFAAAQKGQTDSIAALMFAGADVTMTNNQGYVRSTLSVASAFLSKSCSYASDAHHGGQNGSMPGGGHIEVIQVSKRMPAESGDSTCTGEAAALPRGCGRSNWCVWAGALRRMLPVSKASRRSTQRECTRCGECSAHP
jgi:hypothetical protein